MRWALLTAVVGLGCLAWSGPAAADPVRPARVSDVSGTLSVCGDDDEDEVAVLDRNSVVREGDTLWTDRDSHAELELEHGNWIRLAESTKVEIRTLNGGPELRLWSGSLYLDLSPRQEREVLVDTPEGDVRVSPDSVVRVDLGSDSDVRVSVWSGQASVDPDQGDNERLRSSERVYLESGRLTGSPQRFNRDDRDAFDGYQRDRVDYYIDRPQPRELDQELVGARELGRYGSWTQVDGIRCWRPRCAPGWRPYSYGYWSVVPGWGYTWVDYYPWGYATTHYGRWMYRTSHGWLWYPAYAWGPGWVYWSTWGDYYGWAPLDPWDRPCYYAPSTFIVMGIDIDFHTWTFCHRNRFFYGRHHWRLEDHRRCLQDWKEIRLPREHFHLVRDVFDEIGIPRHPSRGLAFTRDGRVARDRVLELENRLPERRLRSIQERFHVAPGRDRERVRRETDGERLQRAPWVTVAPDQVLHRGEAQRRLRLPASPVPGTPTPTRPEANPPMPERRPQRDDPFRRTQPQLPRPDSGWPQRPNVPRAPERPSTPSPQPRVPGRTPGRGTAPTPAPGSGPRQPRYTPPQSPGKVPQPGTGRMPGRPALTPGRSVPGVSHPVPPGPTVPPGRERTTPPVPGRR